MTMTDERYQTAIRVLQSILGKFEPEGIVIYHVAGNIMFKKTFAHDVEGKGKA